MGVDDRIGKRFWPTRTTGRLTRDLIIKLQIASGGVARASIARHRPEGAQVTPGAPYSEPWILAEVLVHATRRLRFMSYVYIPPLRDPFSAARSIAPVPHAKVPIWVGGHSTAALHRAARSDGWVGVNYHESEVPPLLHQLAEARRGSDLAKSDFAITLALNGIPDAALCRRLQDLGVTGVIVPSWLALGEEPSSLEHKRAGLLRFGERVVSKWG